MCPPVSPLDIPSYFYYNTAIMGFVSLNLKIRIEAAYEKQQIPFLSPWNPLLLLPDRDPSDHICGGGDLLDSGLL